MRKIACILILALAIASPLFSFASPHFVFGDIGQHPDVLMGFLPSYVYAGVGFKFKRGIVPERTTDLQILLGEGGVQRLLWQDPDSGEDNYRKGAWTKDSALRMNVWQNDLVLRFVQGFLPSPVEGKDLLTLTLSAAAKYEKYYGEGKLGPFDFRGNLPSVISPFYSGDVYPELNGEEKSFLGIEFGAVLKVDAIRDTLHANDGDWAKIEAKWAPLALNSFCGGKADYFSLSLINVFAKTLYEAKSEEKSLFSVVIADRTAFGWVYGDKVPSFVTGPMSLGRRTRGYSPYSYSDEFTLVNNLDVRLTGPGIGIASIAPRINVFFDCGLGWGKLIATEEKRLDFLCSTGVQATISFFDFIDLGYEVNFLLTGKEKYSQPGKVTTNFTFFLDF